MNAVVIKLRASFRDCRGASATEYAMMAGILALGLAPAFTALLNRLLTAFNGLAF